ncbi:MAG: ABC transporter permease subunit, partial [Anaerolineae bacterium]|nr:ABC transporter permease subunit [Anaerolineae bacterium]
MLRFLGKKAAFLLVTLVVVSYVTVVIANFGGLIDEALKQEIRLAVRQEFRANDEFRRLPPEVQIEILEEEIAKRIERRGLNQPFITKSFTQTYQALTFTLGNAVQLRSSEASANTFDIIFERLPRTVLLFTTATILSAFLGIWLGLRMARRAMGVFDRGWTIFSVSTFVVPSWVFAIFFILIFAFGLDIFPTGGMVSAPVPTDPWLYALDFSYHLALPLITVTFSSFGSWAYVTRNLVLQTMDEDFVWAARSRGLPERMVLHKYVFRAASPPIVTSLALALITSWTGAIVTETVFQWPGLGLLYFQAILV